MPRQIARPLAAATTIVAAAPAISHIARARGPGDRGCPRESGGGRGKSGLHGTTVPGNARRLFASGVRESATESIPPAFGSVRAKGCGKSAPRGWQQARHGKPHRVQDRIGASLGFKSWGLFRLDARVGCLSGEAIRRLEEWSPRCRKALDRTRLTGPLALTLVIASEAKQSSVASLAMTARKD